MGFCPRSKVRGLDFGDWTVDQCLGWFEEAFEGFGLFFLVWVAVWMTEVHRNLGLYEPRRQR